jgi:outer membrane protein
MRITLITLILTAPLFRGLAQGDGAQVLSLEECVQYALKNNEQVKITSFEKAIADAEVRKTVSMGLPQMEITSGLNYNFVPSRTFIPEAVFNPMANPGDDMVVSFQQNYDANIGLSLKQLIFDGSYFVGLQAARTYRELSIKQHTKSEIDIVEAVSKAYYGVLINRERMELLDKNFGRMDTLLRETQAMHANGFVEKIDVDRLRVAFNNLSVERNKLRQYLDISEKLLKFQMGMDLNTSVVLSNTLTELAPEKVVTAGEFSYNNRIEYSQLVTNQNLVMLDMRNNRVQYVPKLYAQLNYGGNTASFDFDRIMQTDRWLSFGTVGLSLTIPVFDGFYKSNKIQQNKLQLEQIKSQMEYTKKSIDLEIQQTGINLNTSIDALEVQRQNMELAEEIYNITRIKYQEGVGSNLEVMDADAALKEAQTNYYAALFDAVISQIELRKALGTLHR